MLIALYLFIVNVILPQLGTMAYSLLEPVMIIVMILAGIVMLFGVVGMKISSNLGSTVVNGIFKAISYICKTIIQAIGWIIRSIARFIPRLFTESRKMFTDMGLNSVLSNILATVVTAIVLIIII